MSTGAAEDMMETLDSDVGDLVKIVNLIHHAVPYRCYLKASSFICQHSSDQQQFFSLPQQWKYSWIMLFEAHIKKSCDCRSRSLESYS